MILVTGATGGLGNATIQALLKKGFPANEISALVRDEHKAADLKSAGIQIKIGNYNEYDSLKTALVGVDKLLLVSSNEMVDRLVQHKNVINAALENGVKHIVYTGIDIVSYETTVIPYVSQIHKDTADYLQKVGIPYTILDNTLYADSIGMFSGEKFLETGIFFPAGEGKLPWVPKAEMGEAAAVVLTTSGHENKNYAITANVAYSFSEIAEILSEITGQEVKYLKPDAETYVEGLVKAGVPKEIASFLAGFGIAIGNGEFNTHRSDLEKLLGRKPMEIKAYLTEIYG
ncbi:SDR family oxidoreductase [Cytophagaceae bacterium DM2B3-1]|uniref:SDR family oxidoreductase n=1 Tax=Xanthocytophaga flava TaxID=3048013 RepID=A0ABT7CNT9_9BACT|nr:SDR family oxidoreductase [Xanthocytophaga flavus]MDJ1466198.1 SDR family oxidoreductase [Xanthocytophaga flavus]MDJ1495403.1 SDR family oxidoreductase [Xanthocytophaga flavus]